MATESSTVSQLPHFFFWWPFFVWFPSNTDWLDSAKSLAPISESWSLFWDTNCKPYLFSIDDVVSLLMDRAFGSIEANLNLGFNIMDKQVSLLSNQAHFTTATDLRNSSDFKLLRMPLNFKFELQEGVVCNLQSLDYVLPSSKGPNPQHCGYGKQSWLGVLHCWITLIPGDYSCHKLHVINSRQSPSPSLQPVFSCSVRILWTIPAWVLGAF